MRALLLAALLALPGLAGCADPPEPVREATFGELVEQARAARREPQEDDVLVAAAGVEGATDAWRGDGRAPAWAFVYASRNASRLECVLLRASGAVVERHGYPLTDASRIGRGLDDATDTPAVVAAARQDPEFGTAVARAQRWVYTLADREGAATWLVAVVSPAGRGVGVEVDARDGTLKAPAGPAEAPATRAACP